MEVNYKMNMKQETAFGYAEAKVGPMSDNTVPTEEGPDFNRRAGQSLVDSGIGIMVAVIVIGAVAIPVVQDVINSANLTGTAGQILEYTPLALALALFVAAISLVR